jgi:hypothetical protein
MGRLLPYQSNPADLPHRVQQNFFQLLTYRKPVAADFDEAKNVRPTWMPLTVRFPIHHTLDAPVERVCAIYKMLQLTA